MKAVADKSDLVIFGRTITGLQNIADDSREVLQVIAERAFYPIAQEMFDTEGRGRWAPLTPAAQRKKDRLGYADRPILQMTQRLMHSLTVQDAPYNVHFFEDRNSLSIGTSLVYARRQDFLRPILELEEKDIERMIDEAVRHINEQIGKLAVTRGNARGLRVEAI